MFCEFCWEAFEDEELMDYYDEMICDGCWQDMIEVIGRKTR